MSLADTQFKPSIHSKGFDLEQFRRNLDIDIVTCKGDDMTFHMKGASPAVREQQWSFGVACLCWGG